MEVHIVRSETARLVEKAYLSLRSTKLDKPRAQKLEALLFTSILKAEKLILHLKKVSDTNLEVAYRERRTVLKRIADGLAWKFLGFDEHLLRVYAMGKAPGFMAGKTGCLSERQAIETCYKLSKIRFAIQNDITNVLRVADLTVLLSDKTILPIEVKASRRAARTKRTKRQMKRYQAIQTYLREKVSEEIRISGPPLRAIDVSVEQKYYWKELEQVAEEARDKGVAGQVVDNGVLILCYKRFSKAELSRTLQRLLDDAHWEKVSVRFGCLSRHLNPQDSDIVRYVTPITAFQIDPSIVLDFLVHKLDAMILINLEVLKEMFERAGFKTNIDIGNEGEIGIRAPSGTRLQIQGRPLNLLVYGLLTLSSLINIVTSVSVELEKSIKT